MKVIGLIPLYDDDKESYWMLPGYMKLIEKCGALPVMLPLTTDTEELKKCFDMCDGMVMTGGHDVNPAVYGEGKSGNCGIPCDIRDEMERILFEMFMKEDKPILGICRGIQLMNALLGGTLYQHLPAEFDSSTEHHMEPPYNRVAHKVEILPDTPLSEIIGSGIYGVNSYHHQAVKDVAKTARVMAVAEDGLVEAIYVPNKKFVMGLQWHPEFSYADDEKCLKVVKAFVEAC